MVTVADVMTKDVLVLHAEATLRDAVVYLASQHVSGAPVVDARGHVSGAISTSDILQAESEGLDMEATTVEEIMTRPPLVGPPDTALRQAALAMEYGDVHRLFVEQAGKVVGVISRSDVSRALASGKI